MKLAPLLGALWMSGLWTLEANSVAAAERGVSTAQPTAVSEAEGTPAAGRQTSVQLRHAEGQHRAQGASKEALAPRNGRPGIAPHAAGQFAPASGRLHSLPAAKTRVQVVRESNHVGSPSAAANGGRVVPSPFVAHGGGQSIADASRMPARAPTALNAAARASTIVGPQASRRSAGGGPNLARPTHNLSLDGGQLHRKF